MNAARIVSALALGACITALAGCRKPDNSGIYVVTAPREAVFVQIVQTEDGRIAGRFEVVSVGEHGAIRTLSRSLEGAASGHDLALMAKANVLESASVSGHVAGGNLTLAGNGINTNAQRSSLEDYQTAVGKLRSLGASEAQAFAKAEATRHYAENFAKGQARIAFTINQITFKTGELLQLTERLQTAGATEPDFAYMIKTNSEKLKQFAQITPASQMGLRVNQISIANNEVKLQRESFGFQLDNLVRQINDISGQLDAACQNALPDLAAICGDAARSQAKLHATVDHVRTLVKLADGRLVTAMREQGQIIDRLRNN